MAGLLVVVLGVIDQHEAFAAIDLNVIFLLVGLMVIAGILARTGLFEWIAVRCVVLSRGRPGGAACPVGDRDRGDLGLLRQRDDCRVDRSRCPGRRATP